MPRHGKPGAPPPRSNDERYRTIANNIREIIYVLDPVNYRLQYVNPAFERITGLDPARVYADSRAWRRLLHPRDRARVEEELDRRSKAAEPHDLEFRIVRPDGEVRWLWARGVPIRDPQDGLVLVGVAEDVTRRKRAEQDLERSVSLLRATLQATADGILALDGDGRLTTFNDRFAELWKFPDFVVIEAGREDALWNHVLDQVRDSDAFRSRLAEVDRSPETDSFDVLDCRDGRVLEAYSRPRRIGDRYDGRVWSFRDTTARTRAEREIRDRTRRLSLYNQVLSHLARQRVVGGANRKEAFEHITGVAATMLETERVGIWIFDPDHEAIHLIELYERSKDRHGPGERIPREAAPTYFAALEESRTLAMHDVRSDPRSVELVAPYCEPHGIGAMLDAPIRAGSELAGVICFEHVGPARRWTVEEESFAGSIADLVSVALEAADRERAEWAMGFLADASVILSSAIDYRTTIANVVQLAIPTLAEWCVVDLIEDGEIRRVASRHADPAKQALLRELERRYPPDATSRQPAAVALRTGRPELVRNVTEDVWAARARDADHRRLLERLEVRSYIAVPLRARDRTVGAITFARTEQSYDDEDLTLARNLAGRAAMAIDNALLYERAQESNRAKSNFLAVMSHELRTPLSAIVGYADLILEHVSGPPPSDTQREQLERIKLRSMDLARMIDEMLAYARTETGAERPRPKNVDLAALLRNVAAAGRRMAEDAGLAFRARFPDGPWPIETDAERVEHILLNLVSNAVRFTREGHVTLTARSQDGRVLIAVADSGPGIEPRHHERIFEPFVQVDESMTRERGGTGLGLAVARRFARMLGGDIALDSRPGQGSTFTLELPAGRDRESDR